MRANGKKLKTLLSSRKSAYVIYVAALAASYLAVTFAITNLTVNQETDIETNETTVCVETTVDTKETTTVTDGTTVIPETLTENATTETTSSTTTTESTTATTSNTTTANVETTTRMTPNAPVVDTTKATTVKTVPQTTTTATTTTVATTEESTSESSSVTDATEPIDSTDIVVESESTTDTTISETEPTTEATTKPVNTRPVIYDCTLSNDLQQYIYDNCKAKGVPYELVMAIIKTESGFRTNARNGSCVGLMQLHTKYNTGLANSLGVSLYDPYGNVLVGINVVANLLNKYSTTNALICYNMGEYGAKPYLGGSTSYSRKVMKYYYDYLG